MHNTVTKHTRIYSLMEYKRGIANEQDSYDKKSTKVLEIGLS